ncbi:cbb3-type cytochrome c oxidase subunit II, partial [Escherichia coli]|nr:cbb3-type cytochrome c oxidase subunit II [Escherichia coli]
PRYPWLIANTLDCSQSKNKLELMKNMFNVPYTKSQIDTVDIWMENQAKEIATRIYSEADDVKRAFAKKQQEERADFVPLEKREIV